MDIDNLLIEPQQSLFYLERYVNDGSPSGFTELYRTSEPTDPFSNSPNFTLWIHTGAEEEYEYFGSDSAMSLDRTDFLIHPDMANHPDLCGVKFAPAPHWSVVPTSSCRTVQMLREPNDYVKLHYDGVIGRINRRLPRRKAINGPEVSQLLLNALDSGKLHSSFGILHEPFAKIIWTPGVDDRRHFWSLIWRERWPRSKNAECIRFMVPMFALWSSDRNFPAHAPLLAQFATTWGSRARDTLTDSILRAIIDIYFGLILHFGLQNELNAQNILIGFDSNLEPVAIVIRDLMGIEKDIDIMNNLGLSTHFAAHDYKVIGTSIDPSMYSIRHSFAFDFKLSHYVIWPLISLGQLLGLWYSDDKVQETRQYIAGWLRQLPENYFPLGGTWYAHNQELLLNDKKFIANQHPLFRN